LLSKVAKENREESIESIFYSIKCIS